MASSRIDSFFAYIASWDAGDDWTEPRSWRRRTRTTASPSRSTTSAQVRESPADPGEQNAFRRLHGQRVDGAGDALADMAVYDANTDEPDMASARKKMLVRMDLSNTTDLTAVELSSR